MTTSSFGKAFAAARKAGKNTFSWNGKKYTTKLKSENKGKTLEASPKAAPRAKKSPMPKPKPKAQEKASGSSKLLPSGGNGRFSHAETAKARANADAAKPAPKTVTRGETKRAKATTTSTTTHSLPKPKPKPKTAPAVKAKPKPKETTGHSRLLGDGGKAKFSRALSTNRGTVAKPKPSARGATKRRKDRRKNRKALSIMDFFGG
ncbi:hypothetical protein [uncultured Cohaesibacter sp.]|uniref:hypothetical protein n=1 Tax=uncultured Cohaesibacter sp. TaxID=1002546 RepID=UPI0029C6AA77|nr:hypothetical protein [uncultured Cohaesibacter sp.]